MQAKGSTIVITLSLFVALAAGCLTVQESDEETNEPQARSLALAPGNSAATPIATEPDQDPSQLDVAHDGPLEVTMPERIAPANTTGHAIVWVTVHAPRGTAEGPYNVKITDPAGVVVASIETDVERPAPSIEEGQTVQILLTTWSSEGEILDSNDPEVLELQHGEGAEAPEPHAVPVMRHPQIPDRIIDAILAAGPGQNVQAQDAQPLHVERTEPRIETVPRTQSEQRAYEVDRAGAEQQGLIGPDAEVGDPVEAGAPFPFVIERLNETEVVIAVDAEMGDRFTFFGAWADATEVVGIDDESVAFRTTPTTDEGEPFTWREEWPEATTLLELTDDAIRLRHSPAEGLTYTTAGQSGEPVEERIVSVDEEEIHIEAENPNPLAGQTIHLEITVLAVEDGTQAADGTP